MKRHSRFIIAAVLPAGGGLSLTACTDNEVVADVGGHKITRAELEQKAQGQPLKVRDEYYRAERDALNKVIDDYLIEQKAKEEHLTVEQLIKRDIESHVQDPTEDRSVEALLQRRWNRWALLGCTRQYPGLYPSVPCSESLRRIR